MRIFLAVFLFFPFLGFSNTTTTDSLLTISENTALNYKERGEAYNLLAKNYFRISLDTSLYYAKRQLKLAELNSDYLRISQSYNTIGLAYSHSRNSIEGLKNYKLGLSNAKKAKSDTLISFALLNIGHESLRLHRIDTAIVVFKKSIEATKVKNSNSLRTLCLLAAAYNVNADHSNAQLVLLDALELNKTINDAYYNAKINFVIGSTYNSLFDYDNALLYYIKALDLSLKLNNLQLIDYCYSGIGIIYSNTGRYEKAIIIANESLTYYKGLNDVHHIADGYKQLGGCYLELKKLDTALNYFNKSLAIRIDMQDSLGIAAVYSRIGNVYKIKNNFQLANDNYLKALEINERFPHFFNEAYVYFDLGEIYMPKDEKKAIEYYEKSLEISINYGIDGAAINAYRALYEYNKEKGNYKNSLEYYEKYTALNDSVNGKESKIAIEEIETKFEVNKKDNEIVLLQNERSLKELKHIQEQETNIANQKLIFLGFGLILLIVLIIILVYRQKQKNKINSIENKSLKVETQMLRSQMNPHFIFNSLNSIQSFISGNDTIDAERYLSKFSKLMRLILDNSRQSFIVFENEINTLDLYLQLEKLRFDNRFTYEINYNDIDEEFTLVPPMLAQPYIENAILHGIRSVESGHISIDYKLKGTKIICTIDDNGIGREKSIEQNKTRTIKRSSLGIKVTQERIELLAKELNLELTIRIIDKVDSINNPTGTKVIIELPWKD